jgi:hypothetical protein
MFSVEFRDQVRDFVLQMAAADSRVVAGAVVGSLALGEGDRWSDLDLTFAVADDMPIAEVLEDWTGRMAEAFGAVRLFDLPAGASIYRVFLLPGCLQCDLSFTPAASFGPMGPRFRLLFGSAVDRPYVEPQPAQELFGYAVHHALRARFCIERGQFWQAEYWISSLRDYALNLACRRRGLPGAYGRGYDLLPAEVRGAFACSFVTSPEPNELWRALGCAIDGLLSDVGEVQEMARKVEPQLRELAQQD